MQLTGTNKAIAVSTNDASRIKTHRNRLMNNSELGEYLNKIVFSYEFDDEYLFTAIIFSISIKDFLNVKLPFELDHLGK